jgi:hypothetical protein
VPQRPEPAGAVAIDLVTLAASRPFVGGSTDNNILQLTFGFNGLSRITSPADRGLAESTAPGGAAAGPGGSPFGGATGITRLFGPLSAARPAG